MTYYFDGKAYALKKLTLLKAKVRNLTKSGVKPKLDSIIIGNNPASILYQNLKKKAAIGIGAEIRIKKYGTDISKDELIAEINKLNQYPSVNGIMIQLPLPEKFSKKDRDEIINTISPEKDVDGLRKNSLYIPPTAKAVTEIVGIALKNITRKDLPFRLAVVGASGFIGKQIVGELKKNQKFKMIKADSRTDNLKAVTYNCDFVVSVTGIPELIKADMVKDKAVLIDVGSPKGDIERLAYEKSSFASAVPGGVGPVTISCLMDNLIMSASKSAN